MSESQIKDLGWANGWSETPAEVEACRKAKHRTRNNDVGPPRRGLEHVVKCVKCGYVYRYDSSD